MFTREATLNFAGQKNSSSTSAYHLNLLGFCSKKYLFAHQNFPSRSIFFSSFNILKIKTQ
jgi:hypothetical protein